MIIYTFFEASLPTAYLTSLQSLKLNGMKEGANVLVIGVSQSLSPLLFSLFTHSKVATDIFKNIQIQGQWWLWLFGHSGLE
jgi:hypothetical protein